MGRDPGREREIRITGRAYSSQRCDCALAVEIIVCESACLLAVVDTATFTFTFTFTMPRELERGSSGLHRCANTDGGTIDAFRGCRASRAVPVQDEGWWRAWQVGAERRRNHGGTMASPIAPALGKHCTSPTLHLSSVRSLKTSRRDVFITSLKDDTAWLLAFQPLSHPPGVAPGQLVLFAV